MWQNYRMAARPLDELLLSEGLVDEHSLSIARTEALARQRKLAEIVIDLGLVDQRSLARLLSTESCAEFVSPIDIAAVRELVSAIPTHVARRHQVVPIRVDADVLVVAMVDPFEPGLAELIESATGMTVQRAVGVRSEIEMAVLEIYGVDEASNVTLMSPRGLSLDLDVESPRLEGEYSGIPDEWNAARDEASLSDAPAGTNATADAPDADRTAPSTSGALSDSERIAHVERQLFNVSRALALIQSRLDSIDARIANLSSQQKAAT